jgi:cytochrome c6
MYTYTRTLARLPGFLARPVIERLPHIHTSIMSSSKYLAKREIYPGSRAVKLILKNAAVAALVSFLVVPAFAADTGADTFKNKCAMCHGQDGKANTPAGKAFKAVSLRDPMVVNSSDDELITIVKNGKNKMPVFKDKLTEDQIKAVVAYIRTLPD